MNFMVSCTLQKANVRVALYIISKSEQEQPLATVKTLFRQKILQTGTQQGNRSVLPISNTFFFSFSYIFGEFSGESLSLDTCNIFPLPFSVRWKSSRI